MKKRDLTIIALIYLLSFAIGFWACRGFNNTMLKLFVFDAAATVVSFIFSTLLANSSVYDAYWSLTPMVMSIWLFVIEEAFAPLQLLFLLVFNIWSARLTLNWVQVFTDFSYEDWRYKRYREKSHPFVWPLINFWGIHMMPTLVVFAGMLPLFEICAGRIGLLSLGGMLVMLLGVAFEFFADRQMHAHLNSDHSGAVCKAGLWKYSRHPNYLGEITFWLGVFLAMFPYAKERWYYCVGFVSIAILFNFVSIPLMEKRQLERRADYKEYCSETARLLPRYRF